jgi:hypothetical protein
VTCGWIWLCLKATFDLYVLKPYYNLSKILFMDSSNHENPYIYMLMLSLVKDKSLLRLNILVCIQFKNASTSSLI